MTPTSSLLSTRSRVPTLESSSRSSPTLRWCSTTPPLWVLSANSMCGSEETPSLEAHPCSIPSTMLVFLQQTRTSTPQPLSISSSETLGMPTQPRRMPMAISSRAGPTNPWCTMLQCMVFLLTINSSALKWSVKMSPRRLSKTVVTLHPTDRSPPFSKSSATWSGPVPQVRS